MEISLRKPAMFRLKADLIDRLKIAAKRENRSLNNYVESVLMDVVYHEPNSETHAAIEATGRRDTAANRTERFLMKTYGAWKDDETAEEIVSRINENKTCKDPVSFD